MPFPLAGSSGSMKTQVFTTSGVWVKPSKVSAVYLVMVGAGGSGGSGSAVNSGAGGGGGGQVIQRYIPVTSNLVITIGAGGSAPAGGALNPGNAGGSTSISGGASLTATGGHAGLAGQGQVSPNRYIVSGGSGLGGPVRNISGILSNIVGGTGGATQTNLADALMWNQQTAFGGAYGGAGINGLGGGGGGSFSTGGNYSGLSGVDGGGNAGTAGPGSAGAPNTGGGGGGATGSNAGGAGADGLVVITWWE